MLMAHSDLIQMAPDVLLVGLFLEDKWVVDFVRFMVWKVAILPTVKQLPPRRRQSSRSTRCSSITVIDRRVYEHRGYQHLVNRSLNNDVLETTIRALKEPLYTVFLCYSSLLFSPMVFILYFIRWYRRSFPL